MLKINHINRVKTLRKYILALGTLLMTLMSSQSYAHTPENKPDNEWSILTTPTQGEAEPIGSYANGCISGASFLPPTGTGYVDMRRYRGRYYGHPKLINFIYELGENTADLHGKKHLIGDLSQARGGKMNFGHSSHQIGLDADIWMQTVDKDAYVNPSRDMQTIVDKVGMRILDGGIDKATRDALYFSANHDDVARIFVNPVVKWHLCQTEENTAWLRKLRPWWGHDQHFHVRLTCPENAPNCKNQNPPPEGDGCNADLYNWVDEQSGLITGRIKPKAKAKAKSSKKRKPKVLPQQCNYLKYE